MDSVDKAYENLANAIVVKACEDYAALKRGKKRAGVHMSSLVAFFKSPWCGMLCGGVDPMYLMRRIDAEGLPVVKRGRKKADRGLGL